MRDALIDNVLRQVRGTLSDNAARILYNLVETLPEDATVLDISPGEGQSTVIIAKAAQITNRQGLAVLAVDSHVTDPLSSKPHETGTILPFFTNLRTFGVGGRVIPIIGGPRVISQLLNRKSANLVVIQVPPNHVNYAEAVSTAIQEGQFAIRKGGIILVLCPNEANTQEFERVTDQRFGSAFVCTTLRPFIRAYTFQGAK